MKKVEPREHKPLTEKRSGGGGGGDMFSDLLKALDGMGDICMTDSEDENNDSDDEDWND